jgi:hypothetical protein
VFERRQSKAYLHVYVERQRERHGERALIGVELLMTTNHVMQTAVGLAAIALGLAGWTAWSTVAAGTAGASRPDVMAAFANLPPAFVENRGQADARVRYYAQGPRYAFHLTRDAAMLSFTEDARATRGVTLGLRFIGGNPDVVIEGERRVPGDVNYLNGNDPSQWRTALPRHAQVVYRELWPGIDMMLRAEAGTFKYEFRVQPGARISDIRLAYSGANGVELDGGGGLLVQTPLGVMRDAAPVAYQGVGGTRALVASRYELARSASGEAEYGFVVGAGYDPDRALVIDPGLDYSTFLGGSSSEIGYGIAVDSAGNAYVTGLTQSPNFPTTSGAFDRSGAASNFLDAFVTKLNANGTAQVYSTFLGGGNFEWGRAIAIDAAGNAYIAGQTKSSDFPTTGGAFDRTFNVDNCPRCGVDQYDAFVTKLNAAGSALVYSTFLGGFDIDDALSIAVDGAGNAYVGGETGSSNFPVTAGAFDTTRNGEYDAFVTKLNAAGSALVYSTYLGGLLVDYVWDTQVDASGSAYVVGSTRSADFPTVAGSFDTTHGGEFDGFAAKLNPAGSALVYSTFLGGSGFDSASGVAVDAAGNAYVAGGTGSAEFTTTAGAFDTTSGGGFITKLNPSGSALVYSTFLRGAGASSLVVDGTGNAWFTGATGSPDFPATPDAFDTSHNGMADAVVGALNPAGSALVFATFIGGTQSDAGNGIAFDPGGNAVIVGQTYSTDFPTTAGAFDRVWNGDPMIFWGDAFVTKVATGAAPPPPPPPAPAAPALNSPANGATVTLPVTLDWSDVANATSYNVQVDDASDFTSPLVAQQSVAVSQVSLSGLASVQQHWWRVQAVNTSGTSDWSAVRTFTPSSGGGTGLLAAPSLLSPAASARFRRGTSITFDWTDVSGAASYTIQIDDSQSFSAPLIVQQTTPTSQYATSTLPARRMWFRVRANSADSAAGTWSSSRRFEVR